MSEAEPSLRAHEVERREARRVSDEVEEGEMRSARCAESERGASEREQDALRVGRGTLAPALAALGRLGALRRRCAAAGQPEELLLEVHRCAEVLRGEAGACAQGDERTLGGGALSEAGEERGGEPVERLVAGEEGKGSFPRRLSERA